MNSGIFGRILAAGLCCAGLLLPAGKAPPPLMLWSWYMPDEFRRQTNSDFGVAYRLLSLELEGKDGVYPSPRATPVKIGPGIYQMAVIRVDLRGRPRFTPAQRALMVRMVREVVDLAHPQAVQIDFDAPVSARPFYRQLLTELRAGLGPDIFLSMTALVSWCDTSQSWLAGLPVDEIVPMAFSMGQATPATVTMLVRGGQFAFPGCRASIGLELDGGIVVVLPGSKPAAWIRPRREQRAYFFLSPVQWSLELIQKARQEVLP